MEIIKTSDPKTFTDYAYECYGNHSGAIICVHETPSIWTGKLPSFNRTECENRGFYIGEAPYYGGTIVNMAGDISICVTVNDNAYYIKSLNEEIKKYLIACGLSVARDKNDTLVDKKKIMSWASALPKNKWHSGVIHISIGQIDLDTIKAICTKPMSKQPGALCNYGITADNIMPIIENFLRSK